jgi:cobaltochelatase CobS
MARTPSMTPQEAETAIGFPRGKLKFVGAQIRSAVRKWHTAMGLPGKYVACMTGDQWVACYNDTTDATIRLHGEYAINKGLTGEADDETDDAPQIANAVDSKGRAVHVPDATNDAGKLAGVLADILGKGGCNPDMVRAIVDEKLAGLPDLIAKHSPSITVKVQVNDSPAHAIEGHAHKMLPQVIEAIGQNVPVMLVGAAGGGKSTAGEQVAHALGLEFYIQGAASGTHEYIGYKDGAGNYHSTPFRAAFEFGGLFCAEELDSGSPDVPLILNAGLANGHMAFPDSTKPVSRHKDFRIIANANTYGNGADRVYVGRTQLDGATIDRFAFLTWDYDSVLERKLAGNDSWVDRVQALRRAVEAEKARIIVSPRASINGAKMIAAGWSFEQCESAFIWKGADADLRRRIMARAI